MFRRWAPGALPLDEDLLARGVSPSVHDHVCVPRSCVCLSVPARRRSHALAFFVWGFGTGGGWRGMDLRPIAILSSRAGPTAT